MVRSWAYWRRWSSYGDVYDGVGRIVDRIVGRIVDLYDTKTCIMSRSSVRKTASYRGD